MSLGKLILFAATALMLPFSSCTNPAAKNPQPVPQESALSAVTLVAENGQTFTFEVELALTDEEHTVGLMNREYMAPDHGMLFVFDNNRIRTFWMKNTLIPLDMLFISQTGEILGIVHEAAPLTLTGRSIGKPSRYVLELNGGTCKKLGITSGSFVKLPGGL